MRTRSDIKSAWQSPSKPLYLDSAYKQLLHQELKAAALQNRAKALNLNHGHILRQVQNNHLKLDKLTQAKLSHAEQTQMLSRDKQKKNYIAEEQKRINEDKRAGHERRMSTIALGRTQQWTRIREEAFRNRKENLKLIEKNRKEQLSRKKEARNKIHEDIAECRATIKQFFANKHEGILSCNQQEIDRLSLRRMHEEMEKAKSSEKLVLKMEQEMQDLRNTLKESKVGVEKDRNELPSALKKKEAASCHPLVRKIEGVLNQYTKFL